MDLGLTDKVVMITGGSRGLGAASARLFCAEGARVALVARSLERMKTVVEEARHAGHAIPFTHVADLTQERAADEAAETILRQFGRIDVLVSCAGASQGGTFRDISDSVWRDSFELKFMGAVRALRAVLP
ncbi:MAG: SDR family NAD(P)-dependent oxidoreductase, partial [Solimonas sp.]